MPLHFFVGYFKHGSLWAYRLLTYALLASCLLFIAVVLLMRYAVLPNIDDYRSHIVDGLASATQQRVQIGRIEGEWDGFRPRLILHAVSLLDADGKERMQLARVDSTLSWLSLLAGRIRFHYVELEALSLDLRLDRAGNLLVAGIPVKASDHDGGLGDWLLAQRTIVLRNARITWLDERLGTTPLELGDVDFRLEQRFWTHRFGLHATPPSDVASPIDIRGDLRGRSFADSTGWSGRLFLSIAYSNLGELRHWFELPAQTSGGMGSAQVWATLKRGSLSEVTADLALANLRTRLTPDVPELELARLSGRLNWKTDDKAWSLSAKGLTFSTPHGVTLPAADVSYTRTGGHGQPVESDVAFDALELDAVTRLVDRLPVDAALRTRLAQMNPRGRLHGFHVRWRDRFDWNGPYAVRGAFKGVAVSPAGGLPGISQVSGNVDGNEQGGALSLTIGKTALELPNVLAAPVPLDKGQAKISWRMQNRLPKIVLEQIALASPDAIAELTGRYDVVSDGPGVVDFKGKLTEVAGNAVWRYIPLAVPEPVGRWLRMAIVAGTGYDARFTLRGDLRHFPWEHGGEGLFELAGTFKNGRLAYAPGWPTLTGLDGHLSMRGSRLEITGTAGGVYSTKFSGVTCVIASVAVPEPLLEVRGAADGPSTDFLQFVHESPIRARIGGFTDPMRATGNGHLSLSLDIPLQHAENGKVNGTYLFSDNTLDPGPSLPLLEQFSGRVLFTQDDAGLRDGTARIFGMPAHLTAAGDAGHSVRLSLTGQLDVPTLRRLLNQPLLAQVNGTTDWRLSATLTPDRYDFVAESNLVGVTSTLPQPFAKAAQARVPLRIERRERSRTQDAVSVTYGDVVSAQLLVDKSGKPRISRGEIVLQGTAPAPQRDGLWIGGKLDRLDLDQWHDVLVQPEVGTGDLDFGGIRVAAREVRAFSRDFHDVQLDAIYRDGAWLATLDSPQITGNLKWLSHGDGMLVGRFARLELPTSTADAEPPASPASPREGKHLPSLDVTADDFRMGRRQLGKLALTAVPSGADWRIEQLALTNPDGALMVSGLWQAWGVNPRTRVNVKLEVTDIGRFLARMDMTPGIKGGSAHLEGPMSWSGPPYALDIPTLSGRIALKAAKGRFIKLDPGLGKLFSVVSLQTLPKVIALDFADIFSEGFDFEDIVASVDIERGIASTQNFAMEGSAARIELKGDVNLAAETQQLDAKIFPAVSDSVALGTALVNPAIGLGAWVLQKALRNPLGQMLAFEYHVSGTWAKPIVTKKKKDVPEQPPAGRK